MTRYEKLINGTKEEMVNEFVAAIKWARELPEKDWKCLTTGWPGLEGLVRETLDFKLPGTVAEPTGNKYTCQHVHRIYDWDGADCWCTLYNKECDSCR